MPVVKNEQQDSAVELIRKHAVPFPSVSEGRQTFARCFDSFGNAKVLLIGDASHGTSEFYAARAEITKYMIENHGFNIVAIEADWPDAEEVDRYVRRRPRPGPRPKENVRPEGEAERMGKEPAFMRFPTWMWRNQEVQGLVEWLRDHNKGRDMHARDSVGLYGLDLYSMGSSMEAVIEYLEQVDPGMAQAARERYGSLMEWAEDPHEYGLEALMTGLKGYEKQVVDMLKSLLQKRLEYASGSWDGEEFHGAEQNARVVVDAEHYYKAMYYGRNESWNLRDTHMFQTLVRVLKHRGPDSKAIIWAHNSHVGDARATSMGAVRGELNVGQLCRETYGDDALIIGCGTNTGTVAAADSWGGDMQIMKVRPGLPSSYEKMMHEVGTKNFALDLREGMCDKALRDALLQPRLERFIGVIYRPETEKQSHYSLASLPEQLDGFIWFDESRHVGAMEVHQPSEPLEYLETWPFGT